MVGINKCTTANIWHDSEHLIYRPRGLSGRLVVAHSSEALEGSGLMTGSSVFKKCT